MTRRVAALSHRLTHTRFVVVISLSLLSYDVDTLIMEELTLLNQNCWVQKNYKK